MRMKMIVLSMHEECLYAERVLRAGASAYVMKHAPVTQLINAIRAVQRQEIYLSAGLSTQLLQSLAGRRNPVGDVWDQLSDREVEVLPLVGEGYTTREVATSLGVSSKTVESHKGNMRQKLKLQTGAALTRFAISRRGEYTREAQPVA
jgi:DNA-binding NarL/FixJ family response regulator